MTSGTASSTCRACEIAPPNANVRDVRHPSEAELYSRTDDARRTQSLTSRRPTPTIAGARARALRESELRRVSKGLLYHYFPGKRAFYVASVREAARQLLEDTYIDQEPRGPLPDPEDLRAGLRPFLDYVSRRRQVFSFLLRSGIGTDSEVAEIIDTTRRAVVDRMLSRMARFGARTDDPATRMRLKGWLGFLEATSLDWAENQELDLESFLELLVRMAGVVFAAVLDAAEP